MAAKWAQHLTSISSMDKVLCTFSSRGGLERSDGLPPEVASKEQLFPWPPLPRLQWVEVDQVKLLFAGPSCQRRAGVHCCMLTLKQASSAPTTCTPPPCAESGPRDFALPVDVRSVKQAEAGHMLASQGLLSWSVSHGGLSAALKVLASAAGGFLERDARLAPAMSVDGQTCAGDTSLVGYPGDTTCSRGSNAAEPSLSVDYGMTVEATKSGVLS